MKMKMKKLKLIKKIKHQRFLADQRGVTSLEFLFSAISFLVIFAWMVETGFIMVRWAMLERGVDMATRDLRLFGLPDNITTNTQAHDYLKGEICDETLFIKDCENALMLELTSVNAVTGIPNTSASCVDRSNNVDPATGLPVLDEGSRGEADSRDLMYLRACVVIDPILPANYSMPLPLDDSGGIQLVVDNAYINEPS